MKKLIVLTSLAALIFAAQTATAATKWWDINGATDGSGQGTGTGTWNTTGLNWTTDSNGLSAPVTFATGDLAIFSAGTDATNTFTMNTPSALTIGGFTVEEGAVVLTGSALTIGTSAVTVGNGNKLSIGGSTAISASVGATMILDGGTITNTATGSAGSFLSTAMTITLTTNNGTLIYPTAGVLNIVQVGTAPNPGTVIMGPGSLTKGGAGVLAIATACTYGGSTTVTNGELRVRTISNPLPITTDMTVVSPGIFNLNGLSQQIASLSGNGTVGTAAGTLTINGSNSTTFLGAISNVANAGAAGVGSGNGKLIKNGSSTITFAGTNNINGTVTLNAGGITVLTNASLCGPICDINVNGGTLTLSNAAQLIENLAGTNGTIILGAGHTLTSVPFSSATSSSAITGAGAFTYSPNTNTLTQTLNGLDTYTGPTTVTAGTLALGTNGSLANTASISLASGTSFNVSAKSSYVLSTNTTFIASGKGIVVGTNAATLIGASNGTVSLGSQPITLNFDGTNPALYVSQGTLALSSNLFTVNTTAPLAHGTYLIATQATGNIANSGPTTSIAAGTAIGSGDVGFIQAVHGNLNLTVAVIGSNPPTQPAQPGNSTGLKTLNDGTVQISFSGTAGQSYLVQATTNLIAPITWVTVSTNTADTNGLFQFNDLNSTNLPLRFYRTTTP